MSQVVNEKKRDFAIFAATFLVLVLDFGEGSYGQDASQRIWGKGSDSLERLLWF
jgi:hypothetical protein